jgi:hypothetical protein
MENLAPPEAVDLRSLRGFFAEDLGLPSIDNTPWEYRHDLVGLSTSTHRKRDRLTPWITKKLEGWKGNHYFKAFLRVREDRFISSPKGNPTPKPASGPENWRVGGEQEPYLSSDMEKKITKALSTRVIHVTHTYPDGRMLFRFDSEAFSDGVEVFLLLIASAINVSSMYSLYAIENMQIRFAVIWAFTVVFMSTMRLLTPTDTINMLTAMVALVVQFIYCFTRTFSAILY